MKLTLHWLEVSGVGNSGLSAMYLCMELELVQPTVGAVAGLRFATRVFTSSCRPVRYLYHCDKLF